MLLGREAFFFLIGLKLSYKVVLVSAVVVV